MSRVETCLRVYTAACGPSSCGLARREANGGPVRRQLRQAVLRPGRVAAREAGIAPLNVRQDRYRTPVSFSAVSHKARATSASWARRAMWAGAG
ncbi:MAG: hypothetical protein AMXMBFR64_04210 [Myxococcales bacterium]